MADFGSLALSLALGLALAAGLRAAALIRAARTRRRAMAFKDRALARGRCLILFSGQSLSLNGLGLDRLEAM
jgi:hypothetical protein